MGLVWMRFLLFAALLLGFSAMHTLGHPAGESHSDHGVAAETVTTFTSAPDSVSGATTATGPDVAHSLAGDLPDLDPTSMCLALGVLGILLLGVAATAFERWPEPLFRPSSPFRRFDPPAVVVENKPSLSALQVLRV